MNKELREKAERIARLPYDEEVIEDETTDGKRIILALNPQLEGCMAQGKDVKNAVENLREARIEFILSLLEDGLPVPLPEPATTTSTITTTGDPSPYRRETIPPAQPPEQDFMETLGRAVQPERRKKLYSVSSET